jgi:hypothetical protein
VTESGNVPRMRRRRTRRHRRNRLIRRCIAAAGVVIFAAGTSAVALKYLTPSLFRAHQSAPPTFEQAELSRERLLSLNQLLSQTGPSSNRPVYPYSVIPGGVEDAKELKWVAEHDPVVGAHYAGFDYDHARIVRLTLAETVYLSYRIGNHIYWTRHRLTLHKGEKVLTDGKITARIRCANRVEKLPQQAAAPNEPPVVEFDRPVGAGTGTALQAPPVPFQSALLEKPAIGPTGPLSLYDPIGGGGWVPISPPSLPPGLCSPTRKKTGKDDGCCLGVEGGEGAKKKGGGGPCAPGVVPEPGTWVLFATGLIVIGWQARRKFLLA